jgi:hypothetical protein
MKTPIPEAFLIGQSNLINTLVVALGKLGAPEDTVRALTENGDVEHVHWWLSQSRLNQPGDDAIATGGES